MAAGTDIGPYRIVEEIGRGGMGVVYDAEDTRLRRTVALKALPAEYARDPVRRERLTREARAAAALTHPSIATIYALEEHDGSLYLVSELVRGQTLRDELARGPLPPERLLPTLIELASGLAAAHAAGIVHRDFKPENIVRCLDGRVKILDFGLARLAANETRLTQTGTALGTPGYMPPEQLAGQDVDARTDVFAFGVVGVGTGHRRPSARGKRRRADGPHGGHAGREDGVARWRAAARRPRAHPAALPAAECRRALSIGRVHPAGAPVAATDRRVAGGRAPAVVFVTPAPVVVAVPSGDHRGPHRRDAGRGVVRPGHRAAPPASGCSSRCSPCRRSR